MVPRDAPSLRNQRRGTDSPAARQEFRWTEEKKETLEPGVVITSDRQMRTHGEDEGPVAGGRGHGISRQSCTWLNGPRAAVHSSREGGLNYSPIQRLCSSEVQL